MPWADRQNVIYEVIRPTQERESESVKMKRTPKASRDKHKIV